MRMVDFVITWLKYIYIYICKKLGVAHIFEEHYEPFLGLSKKKK